MSVMTARARLRLMLASIYRPAATASSANVPSHHEASSQVRKGLPLAKARSGPGAPVAALAA
jgi:hypothetical protein